MGNLIKHLQRQHRNFRNIKTQYRTQQQKKSQNRFDDIVGYICVMQ
jgi:hypothetical protein